MSVSEIAREALAQRLGRVAERRKLPFVALGRSGYHDTAARMEEILRDEWARDIDPRR